MKKPYAEKHLFAVENKTWMIDAALVKGHTQKCEILFQITPVGPIFNFSIRLA